MEYTQKHIGESVKVVDIGFIKKKEEKERANVYLGTLAEILAVDCEHRTLQIKLFDGLTKWTGYGRIRYSFEVEE